MRAWITAARRRAAAEDGNVTLLTLGFLIVVGMLIVVGIDLTAVQVARTQLWDAADGAALSAANSANEAAIYQGGLGGRVPLTSSGVAERAGRYLSADRKPTSVTSWRLGPGTGSPDGQTAEVVLTGHVELPILGVVAQAWSGGVEVTVRSSARATVT